MADGAGEIIIRGGSCEIHYDNSHFEPNQDRTNPTRRAYRPDVKIKRIVITGNRKFDSEDIDDGFVGDIKITYEY
jgi:hypothetical protein